MFRSRFSACDGLVILLVLLLAVALFFLPRSLTEQGEVLVIRTPEGECTYPLSESRSIDLTANGIALTVEIADGRARISSSGCPDGVCVHSGWISRGGEAVICAPAEVRILIKGTEETADVDQIIG